MEVGARGGLRVQDSMVCNTKDMSRLDTTSTTPLQEVQEAVR